MHSEARAELRSVRSELDSETSLRKTVESRLELVLIEFQGERERFEEQTLKLENQIHEAETRLKETKDQNELFHSQVTSLADSIERLRSEKIQSFDMTVENVSVEENPSDTDRCNAEVNQLRLTVSELREVIASMRSERELLDAQADALKQTLERERASSSVVRRSLDEARHEIRMIREASQESGKDEEINVLKTRLKGSEEQIILLRESNILLREESDKLKASLNVCEKSLADAQNAVEPTLKKIRDLEVANSSLLAEKASVTSEVDAWKGRVQSLVARFHPIDPEDHSKAVARAEKSEKECETWKSLKVKAEQETVASKALIVRLNKEISQHKENLESTNQIINNLKLEKEAMAKSLNEMQSSIISERDKLNSLIQSREKQIDSLETDLNLKNSRLDHLTSLLRRQKQMLADSQKTQAALQKKVEDQEELIKNQANVASTHDRTIETMSIVVANEEAEFSTEKQTKELAGVSAQTSTVPGAGLGINKDVVMPTQESEEQDDSIDKGQIEPIKEQIPHTPAGLETQSLRENATDVEVVGIDNQASSQPATPAASLKSKASEKEAQKEEGSSDALVKQQSLLSDQKEALESLRGKLLKKKRALEAAKTANKGKPQPSSISASAITAQAATPSKDEVAVSLIAATMEGELSSGKDDHNADAVAGPSNLPQDNHTKTETEQQHPSVPLFGSKSNEEFLAAPFSFGSSSSIKLPIPSKLPASPSPFGAFSGTFGGGAPLVPNPLFGAGGSALTPAPLFGETKKRSQPDNNEDEEKETSVKQARMEIESSEHQPKSINSVVEPKE